MLRCKLVKTFAIVTRLSDALRLPAARVNEVSMRKLGFGRRSGYLIRFTPIKRCLDPWNILYVCEVETGAETHQKGWAVRARLSWRKPGLEGRYAETYPCRINARA